MKIKKIWFSDDCIYGADESGKEYRQSLLWYPNLYNASEEERNSYKFGHDGIHWRNLDEDVSFESFEYEDAEPTPIQRFFLTHRDIDLDALSKCTGIDVVTINKYINGFLRPTEIHSSKILSFINDYELSASQVTIACEDCAGYKSK